jgi:hemerythrin-like metal-binding protein
LTDGLTLHLIDLINKLGTLIIDNFSNKNDVKAILREILEYTGYHFKEEQNVMASFGVDSRHISEHIIAHQSFLKDIRFMFSNLTTSTDSEYFELFDYLVHWLAYHILGTDQEMARQASIIKSGNSPSEAYNIVNKNSNIAEPLLIALKELFQQVSEKNRKLVDLNNTLEQKVMKRTSELSELNSQLESMSYTDHLTQLKNRRYGLKEMAFWWEKSLKQDLDLSCMMIDADNFKSVNDNHGHEAGDVVIQTIATTLDESINTPYCMQTWW